MDNIEKLWCHSVTTDEQECGKTISCSYAENIACYISNKNFMCTSQHHKLNSTGASKQITGIGNLKRIHYLSFYDTVFAATEFDLYVLGRHTFQTQFYYVVSKPISALCWNPAEDTLAITHYSDEIALYNFSGSEFEPRYAVRLHNSPPQPSPALLGWGSHGSQFPAPLDKSAKDGDVILLSDENPTIAWQNNGELVAVNFQRCGKRFIKVFDNELKPLYMTEEYLNLERSLSFSPTGKYLASSAVRSKVNTIVIFEKNCFLWQVFEVRENKGIIKRVEYHPAMNLLAVYSINGFSNGYLNIYLQSNSKWYLKQSLFYPSHREIRHFQWINLPEAPFTIVKMVIFTAENIEYHTFRFIINRCPNSSIVAAVNGRDIDFYNFSEKIIPSPMKIYTTGFLEPINYILFHPTAPLAIVLDSKLQGYIVNLRTYEKILSTSDLCLLDIAWFHDVEWNRGTEIQVNIAFDGNERWTFSKVGKWTLKISTFKLARPHYLLPYNDTDCFISYKILGDLFCSMMYMTRRIVKVGDEEVTLDFAMSSNEDIYVNDNLLYHGATSLYIFKDYVLFTNSSAKLFCVRLLDNINLFNGELDVSKLYSRDTELGARIINASNEVIPQIILSIPRGNIETICCKMMAVDVVEQNICSDQWEAAIELMRAAKVNWNVLVDLNPKRFLKNIPVFVKAASYCSVLSTIVNEFGTIEDTYLLYLPKTANTTYDKHSIVLKVMEYLTSTNCVKNLNAIVSIQLKHISLKAALSSIRDVFEAKVTEYEIVCKKALQILLLKQHLKDVLNVAYTLYNTDFLQFVYSNSGEDPRVYEPEIAQFRSLDLLDLRFRMSVKANELNTALKYLMRCPEYDAEYIEAFLVKHNLEAYAYTTLPRDVRFYELIGYLYARQLSKQKNYSEAGFVLKRVDMLSEALDEYRKALDWTEVIIIVNLLEYEERAKKEILYELADNLVKAHRVDEAVQLMEYHNKDYKKAIEILVENKYFKKAIAFARLHEEKDLLRKTILPQMTVHMEALYDKLDDFRQTFEKYVNRLKIVRQNRKISLDNIPLGHYEPDEPLSDTDSTATGSSRSSSRSKRSSMSSKNRRKEERKKTNLREGGQYEDIALIRALYLLYIDVFSMGQEVRDIGLTLEHEEMGMAKKLHDKLAKLQDDMKKAILEIWPVELVTPPPVVDNNVLAVIQNKADLDPKYWRPPPQEILDAKWQLDMFCVAC